MNSISVIAVVSLAMQLAVIDEPCAPHKAGALYESGMAAKAAGEYDKAIADLVRALDFDNNHADAHWVLAWVYASTDNKQLAAIHFHEVIRLLPDDGDKAGQAKQALQRMGLLLVVESGSGAHAATFANDPEVYLIRAKGAATYHRDNCRQIVGISTPMLKSSAIQMSANACPLCQPDLAEAPEADTWQRGRARVQRTIQWQPVGPQRTGSTVYITNTGDCYHTAGCTHLRQSRIPISLSKARAGYRPCKHCKPPR